MAPPLPVRVLESIRDVAALLGVPVVAGRGGGEEFVGGGAAHCSWCLFGVCLGRRRREGGEEREDGMGWEGMCVSVWVSV